MSKQDQKTSTKKGERTPEEKAQAKVKQEMETMRLRARDDYRALKVQGDRLERQSKLDLDVEFLAADVKLAVDRKVALASAMEAAGLVKTVAVPDAPKKAAPESTTTERITVQ